MQKDSTLQKLNLLIQKTKAHKHADFYRNIWGEYSNFTDLPLVSADNFIKTPLRNRIYKTEKGFTKVVRHYGIPFLVQWSLKDLAAENYGFSCERPLVFLSNHHEAVEKSLWFYEHNTLPLIGESNNVTVTAYTAKRYKIDALVTEPSMFLLLIPVLEKEYDISRIKTLTFIGDRFDIASLTPHLKKFNSVRFVLALPETGTFAESCPYAWRRGELIFHPEDNSVMEIVKGPITITKITNLTTPIIRYQTDIFISPADVPSDTCGKESFALL